VARRLALLNTELGSAAGVPAPGRDRVAAGDLSGHRTGGLGEGEPPPWWDTATRVATPRPGGAGRRRPAPDPRPDAAAPGTNAQPPALPIPGRHAARGPRRQLSMPARPATPFGAAQIAVVAVVAAVALAITAWVVVLSDEQPIDLTATNPVSAAPLVDPGALAPPSGAPLASEVPGSGASPGTVVVDVAGKVRRPGIAVLPAGSRVVDALEAAGGPRPGVRLTSLNLARLLVDGEQIVVGVAPVAGAAASAVAVPGAPTTGQLVNLNTAGAAELDTLPQVGPVTAQAILAYRDQHGGFASVDELLDVDGIGEVTLARIAPFVTV
jgi:competence protein ComEA